MINRKHYRKLKIEKDLAIERDLQITLQTIYAPPATWCRWTDGLLGEPHTPHTYPVYSWLEHVGGIAMSNIETESDIIHAAYSAPTILLFGLAYGRLIDCTSRHPTTPECNHPTLAGDQSEFTNRIKNDVIERGLFLQEETMEAHPICEMYIPADMSCATREALWEALVLAPDDFILGQVTSWLLTNISGGEEMRNGWTPAD